jgi:hypothetical protein
MALEIYQGDSGTYELLTFYVDTSTISVPPGNVSNATLELKKPSGGTVSWEMSRSVGYVASFKRHVLTLSVTRELPDFDEIGTWKFYIDLTIPGSTNRRTKPDTLTVLAEYG